MSTERPIAELAAEMAFRHWQPAQTVVPAQQSANLAQNLIGDLQAESANLILPPELEAHRQILLSLADVPRMSSLAIGLLLFEAVRRMSPAQSYLNIGVWQGFSLLLGMLAQPHGNVIGVDNFSEWGGPRAEFAARFAKTRGPSHRFYEMDYLHYFKNVAIPPLGVYFYDGPHRELDQSRGLELAHPHLAPGALVFVDDTNLFQVQAPTMAFLQNHPEYRLLFNVYTEHNRHPTWWNGLMILQKAG